MTDHGKTESPPPGTVFELPSTDTDTFEGDAVPLGPASRIYLVARVGERTQVVDLVDGGEITVGRAPESSIVADEARVSRHHARVWRAGASVWIEDLGSRNGTRLNE